MYTNILILSFLFWEHKFMFRKGCHENKDNTKYTSYSVLRFDVLFLSSSTKKICTPARSRLFNLCVVFLKFRTRCIKTHYLAMFTIVWYFGDNIVLLLCEWHSLCYVETCFITQRVALCGDRYRFKLFWCIFVLTPENGTETRIAEDNQDDVRFRLCYNGYF